MGSIYSERGAVAVALGLLLACGREDVELSHRSASSPSEGGRGGTTPADASAGNGSVGDDGDVDAMVEDCSAEVPQDLLSPRPPLGWDGYNAFNCRAEYNQAKIEANVAALVDSGMQAAGYEYVMLDGCFQKSRAADGTRVYDAARLPDGIEALAQRLHQRGLLLGVSAPIRECLASPAGEGYEDVDAQSYANWGVDYVKAECVDGSERALVERIAQAVRSAPRRMVLGLATAPFGTWMPDVAQVWRTGPNAAPTWASIVQSIDLTTPLAAYARPGGFNDPDMLELGNGSLSAGEQRVQLAVWAILAAPLLAGNDLTAMTEPTRALLTNPDVIALDQDPLGLQGALIRRDGDVEILTKPLAACGARGLVLWNRGDSAAKVRVSWPELWLRDEPALVEDLWTHSSVPAEADGVALEVEAHDALALRVSGQEPALPRGEVYLSDLDVTYAVSGYGPVELDRSNGEDAAGDGRVIRLRGAAYEKGLGVNSPSLLRYRLGRKCSRFVADVGIDDEVAGRGNVEVELWADGVRLFQSGVLTGKSPPKRVDVNVTGRRELRLFVGTGSDDFSYDHLDWAGARLVCADLR